LNHTVRFLYALILSCASPQGQLFNDRVQPGFGAASKVNWATAVTERKETVTGERLIAAARIVFAEHGCERATVRDICILAKANVASVNYHFGSKSRLYDEVMRDHLERKLRQHPYSGGLPADAAPEQRLRAFITSLLARFQTEADPVSERLSQLLAQEFLSPTSERNLRMFEQYLKPVHRALLGIMKELVPGADDEALSSSAASVIGQCAIPGAAKATFARLSPPPQEPIATSSMSHIDRTAAFILNFTLGGLHCLDRVQNADGTCPAGIVRP
jgi:AcrR family transcriptional regulator